MIVLGQTEASRKATCTCMIIARNCQRTIRPCLESAISSRAFDEILVVLDTRTSDRTPQIVRAYARRFPIRLMWWNWKEPADFAEVRNAADDACWTEYGFWLDCDERIADAAALRQMLIDPRGRAFAVWVVSPMRGGGTFDMYQPRLFPRNRGARFECPIFERLDWSLRKQGVEIVNTQHRVIQHGGYLDRAILRRKNLRNLKSLKKWLSENKTRDYKWEHLNDQYQKLRFLEGKAA